MAEIIKIGMLGLMGVLLAVQFKTRKPEYGIYIGFAVGVILFAYAVRQVEIVMRQFEQVRAYLGGAGGYLSILMKVIGITYICEFSAGICRDAGFGAVAAQLEILGKLSVIFAGLPILFTVIEQIQALI